MFKIKMEDINKKIPQKKSVALLVLLSIVSIGIYPAVWYIKRVTELNNLNTTKKLGKGLPVILLILAIISILVFLGVFFFWKEVFIGFVIAVSMFIALITTSFTSLSMTLIIKKVGQDPALGSGPLATVISDITSIITYFLIASWLL